MRLLPLLARRVVPLFILATLLMAAFARLHAAEYSIEKDVRLNGIYRSSAGSAAEIAEYNLQPNVGLLAKDGVSSVEFNLGAHFRRFDKDQFDSDEYDTRLIYENRLERLSNTFFIGSRRSSTFIDEEIGEDSQFNSSRTRKSQVDTINLSSNYRLTLRSAFQLNLGGVKRNYDTSDQVDSDSLTAGLVYSFQLSERIGLRAQVSGQQYEAKDFTLALNSGGIQSAALAGLNFVDTNVTSIDVDALLDTAVSLASVSCLESDFDAAFDFDQQFSGLVAGSSSGVTAPCYSGVDIDNTQKVYGGKLGFTYQPTENLDMDVLLGRSNIDTELRRRFLTGGNPDVVSSGDNELTEYSYQLNYRAEKNTFAFRASRETRGSGIGSVQLKDLYSFSLTHVFDSRSSGNLLFDWFDEEALGVGFESFDRERFSAGARYTYRVTEFWKAIADYTYYVDRRRIGDDNERQRVMLAIQWTPAANKWSR